MAKHDLSLTVRLPGRLVDLLDRVAVEEFASRSYVVRFLLIKALRDAGRLPAKKEPTAAAE